MVSVLAKICNLLIDAACLSEKEVVSCGVLSISLLKKKWYHVAFLASPFNILTLIMQFPLDYVRTLER